MKNYSIIEELEAKETEILVEGMVKISRDKSRNVNGIV